METKNTRSYLLLFFEDKDFTSFMPIYIIKNMVNISEHTAYWKNGAVEDFDAAEQYMERIKEVFQWLMLQL
jgi:hypothetical protein